MNETTEVGAKAKGKKAAKKAEAATPGVDGQIGRMLVRAIWAQEWMTANPEAKPEERKAAWKEGRAAAMEKNLKAYRRALNAMTRSGLVMSISPDLTEASEDDDA